MIQLKSAGKIKQKIARVPKIIYFISAGVLLMATYVFSFILPRTIEFSYAGDNCRTALVFLPNHQKTSGDPSFTLEYQKKIAGTFATQLCVKPVAAPEKGERAVQSSPFGWPLFQSNYQIKVTEPPQVVGSQTNAPIAIKKPVVFTINQPDNIFNYSISTGDHTQSCSTKPSTIECGVDKLNLKQGDKYTLELMRDFNSRDAHVVTSHSVSILPATTITEASVKNDELVYAKPKTFTFTTDKPVTKVTAKLELIDEDKVSTLTTASYTEDKSITVAVDEDLPREKTFRLTVESVESSDGSDLNESYVTTFKTSGGPKVTSVNIGNSGVDPSAQIVIGLDQPIAPAVDIIPFVKIEGVSAAVSKRDNLIILTLNNASRCAAFNIRINKGITSEVNGLTSKEDWTYSSRINCRATSVIGYSVKGRPIVAYYYGSGSTTILFTGGMHGSEPSGYSTMMGWINHLDTNAHKIPAGRQVVVVPNTNPDGIATGSRYNANNVNIDRNFATANWKSDINTASGLVVGGGGSAPMSEPETRALANLTSQLRPRAEISFHAQGRLIGANQFADSEAIGNIYASTVGYTTMYNNAEEIMGYELTGEYEIWMGEKLGLPAILIELPSHSGNYFNSQQAAIWKMVNL